MTFIHIISTDYYSKEDGKGKSLLLEARNKSIGEFRVYCQLRVVSAQSLSVLVIVHECCNVSFVERVHCHIYLAWYGDYG